MRTLLAFLLFTLPLSAQTPTQVKGFFGEASARYDLVLQPTLPGQAIVLYFYFATNEWVPGPACNGNVFCDWNLFDSQGNQFVRINRDNQKLVYVPASRGGQETITLIGTQVQNLSFVAMVFPDTLVLQDVVPSQCAFMPKVGQVEICSPWMPTGSTVATDDSSTISSYSLVSSVPNELFIGIGSCSSQCSGGVSRIFSPASGWAVPTWGGEIFMSYVTVTSVGTQETFTLYPSPPLGEGNYSYLGIQGFKVIPIEPVIIQ